MSMERIIGNWRCVRTGASVEAQNFTSGEKLTLRLVPLNLTVALFGEESALMDAFADLTWGEIEQARATLALED